MRLFHGATAVARALFVLIVALRRPEGHVGRAAWTMHVLGKGFARVLFPLFEKPADCVDREVLRWGVATVELLVAH